MPHREEFRHAPTCTGCHDDKTYPRHAGDNGPLDISADTRTMRRVRHIGFKLILVVGVTAILIISIFAYFNIRSLSTSLLAEVERHANQLSETVKHSTRYDMLLNQRDRIHQAINAIGQQPTIGRSAC